LNTTVQHQHRKVQLPLVKPKVVKSMDRV